MQCGQLLITVQVHNYSAKSSWSLKAVEQISVIRAHVLCQGYSYYESMSMCGSIFRISYSL